MRAVWAALALFSIVIVAGCAPRIPTYNGPEVTRIVVFKDSRRMYLMHDTKVLRSFDVDLGFAPEGDKQIEGDGKTPEGVYEIDRRNPQSEYHLSLGISYPNENDVAEAKALGESPGGDIFIHGGHPRLRRPPADWTWGCIAVSDREIEDIYAMVQDGTPIAIFP